MVECQLPKLKVASSSLVARSNFPIEKWMSSMMAVPIVGSLAGNVLKRFRVELDYLNSKLYLSAT